ncbi:hypothetical protein VB264_24455 [Arcicella aquatica]|uniref:Uncharacterized protein n=1 Tax=Arcicella aquatica TaxID=217141 RepID=A0ABU5QVA5_9BACT|nr:hypothetical protein [Arcicella aquatica]MEA5260973.1 hypothetical protein [Arcicella aquatica]
MPELPQSDNNELNGMMNGITSSVEKLAKDAISIGWGYYVSLLGILASFFFNKGK